MEWSRNLNVGGKIPSRRPPSRLPPHSPSPIRAGTVTCDTFPSATRASTACRSQLYSSGIDCLSPFPIMGEQPALGEASVAQPAQSCTTCDSQAQSAQSLVQSSAELHNLRIPLPPYWRAVWASSEALPYYYNRLTHETTWCYYEEVDQRGMPDLPPGWQRAWHPRGSRWFYWGPETQEATCTCPNRAWYDPPEPPPSVQAVADRNWRPADPLLVPSVLC